MSCYGKCKHGHFVGRSFNGQCEHEFCSLLLWVAKFSLFLISYHSFESFEFRHEKSTKPINLLMHTKWLRKFSQELVKYSQRLGENVSDLQKALELMLSVPHRAIDNKFLASIEGFRGMLGTTLQHSFAQTPTIFILYISLSLSVSQFILFFFVNLSISHSYTYTIYQSIWLSHSYTFQFPPVQHNTRTSILFLYICCFLSFSSFIFLSLSRLRVQMRNVGRNTRSLCLSRHHHHTLSHVGRREWINRMWRDRNAWHYLGNIHKLGRLLGHEWWTVTDKDKKARERYLFLFKSRILVCKVRRISEDRSVFILKDIIKVFAQYLFYRLCISNENESVCCRMNTHKSNSN